ncbi:hypothetical protein FHG87_007844 [Trinorchestia longiramus]|nr:hypothetical protein FHG87_007844 [Trinorchestia longiramus]
MCAFMTPVLKSDWEVYDTKKSLSPNASSSDVIAAHRAQQLMRLRQIQQTRRQLLGRSASYNNAAPSARDSAVHLPRGHLSAHCSRTSLPVSPLTVDRSRSKTKKSSSSSSLNNFHTKVLDKLKTVLHMKDDPDPADSPDAALQEELDAASAHPELFDRPEEDAPRMGRRSSRPASRTSRSSSEFPNIAEETVDSNGVVVVA